MKTLIVMVDHIQVKWLNESGALSEGSKATTYCNNQVIQSFSPWEAVVVLDKPVSGAESRWLFDKVFPALATDGRVFGKPERRH